MTFFGLILVIASCGYILFRLVIKKEKEALLMAIPLGIFIVIKVLSLDNVISGTVINMIIFLSVILSVFLIIRYILKDIENFFNKL